MPSIEELIPYSAHNIELRDGRRTIPQDDLLLTEQAWMTATLRTIDALIPSNDKLRIVDLGCLEGGYSIEFARRGHDVVGIDARALNIDRAVAAKENLRLSNVSFAVDDVKNLADYGQFDIVFCSGLLYHLDDPKAYIDLMGAVARKALILNTHYAREVDPFYDVDEATARDAAERTNFALEELTEHEGLPGRWYPEYSADDSRDEIDGRLWAAFSNEQSFWPTKPALLGACRDAGFAAIYEQHDFVDNIAEDDYATLNDRGMFVCVKPPTAPAPPTGLVGQARDLARPALNRLKTITRREHA